MLKLFLLAAVQAAATQEQENPIRRIVNLLQKMAEEVEAEIKKDEDMHEKFECYCKVQTKNLDDSIAALNEKIPQIEADIKECEAGNGRVAAELAQHKQDRADANEAIESATAQRDKEAEAFDKLSSDLKANIAACSKAIDAISKGMGASFLQSGAAVALKKLVLAQASSLRRYERETLTAFLSADQSYAPASGEIVGILKQLLENMEGDLKEATDTENAAIAEFEGLVAAKKKEIQAATEAIEAKTERAGEGAVQLVNLKNDLEDAQESLEEDTNYLAELLKSCKTSGAEYEERQAMRAQEKVAIAETVKILNDDDALDLFKKSLPSPGESFLQMPQSGDVRDEALAALATIRDSAHPAQTGLIQLALLGKKAGFEKIVKMIDDMVVLLGDEQKNDDKERDFCNAEFDKSEDNQKELKRKIGQLETQQAEMADAIATLKDEIAALVQGIKDLDSAVAEATAQRKAEHADFVQTSAENNAALQLLEVAKNRLNKFYNPKLYKAPPKRELTEEERLYVASGGVLTTPAPGGIAGTGIAVFAQVRAHSLDDDEAAPPPPPETMGAYTKKDSSGPIALIDGLKNDLEKDIQAGEFDEKDAQEEYEEMMKQSAKKRATDSKTINEKEEQKGGLEGDLEDAKAADKAAKKELLALGEYIAQLHAQCDFLLDNFDLRKEARAGEIDALKKAKAVLSGADYSLGQGFLARN